MGNSANNQDQLFALSRTGVMISSWMATNGFRSKLTGAVLLLPGGATWQTLMLRRFLQTPSLVCMRLPIAPDAMAKTAVVAKSRGQFIFSSIDKMRLLISGIKQSIGKCNFSMMPYFSFLNNSILSTSCSISSCVFTRFCMSHFSNSSFSKKMSLPDGLK